MSDAFETCVAFTLEREGGFVNNPADPGGATNLGITLATLQAWRETAVSRNDVRNLGVEEAKRIYRANYWEPVQGGALPVPVALMVFDCAVNSGPKTSIRFLQQAVGTAADGAIGPKTLAAVRERDVKEVLAGLCNARLAYLRSLPTWGTFGRGWSARVDAAHSAALKLV